MISDDVTIDGGVVSMFGVCRFQRRVWCTMQRHVLSSVQISYSTCCSVCRAGMCVQQSSGNICVTARRLMVDQALIQLLEDPTRLMSSLPSVTKSDNANHCDNILNIFLICTCHLTLSGKSLIYHEQPSTHPKLQATDIHFFRSIASEPRRAFRWGSRL